MARLTAFSRLLITLAIIGGVYFAVTKFMPQLSSKFGNKGGETTETSAGGSESAAKNDDTNSGGASSPVASAGTSFSRAAFNFTPPPPVNGKMKGVVELGATGFNSFVIRVDAQKNWKLEKAEFGASLIKEGMTSDQEVKSVLKQYISDMIAYGVNGKDIHFVISSGAKKEKVTETIIRTLGDLGYFVNTVTPEQEAKLALKSAMPAAYSGRAFVVDIGSGNSKISWMERGSVAGLETHGSKYYQNNVSDDAVAQDVKAKSRQVPAALRETCFIIGGVPFEFAKKIRSGKERYTVLPSPADIKAEGAKQVAGLNIYNAVAEATGCKQFIFDWDANFTIGFLLNM